MKVKQNYTFRKPTGPNLVGCTNLYYQQDEQEKRVIPCLCFYPAAHKGENKTKKYISENILPNTQTLMTNSYVDAPVLEGKHPLLIFNHSYSLFNESNTVQCEHLASYGYIVLCIGHPKGGSYVYEDGSISLFDIITLPKKVMEDYALGAQLFNEYNVWLTNNGDSASKEDHLKFHNEINKQQDSMVMDSDVWIQDNYFVLNKFLFETKLNIYDSINHQQIGAFGMAFGGAAVLGLSQITEQIKAVANLDGFYYGVNSSQPLSKPTLLLQNESGKILTFPFLNANGPTYLVDFKNATHANFADYNEFLAENIIQKGIVDGKFVEQGLLGKIDPNLMEDLINLLLLDFFNKYLLEIQPEVIDNEKYHDSITIKKKI